MSPEPRLNPQRASVWGLSKVSPELSAQGPRRGSPEADLSAVLSMTHRHSAVGFRFQMVPGQGCSLSASLDCRKAGRELSAGGERDDFAMKFSSLPGQLSRVSHSRSRGSLQRWESTRMRACPVFRQSGSAKPIRLNSCNPFNSGSRFAFAAPRGATKTVSGSPSPRKRLTMNGHSLFEGSSCCSQPGVAT